MSDPESSPSSPVVGPERSLPEITIKAVILGILLAMLMAAANAYLGLRVGMTVAASIPASAISLGVLRFFRRSNILENNQVQTIASAGASTVSGIIFTVPALVLMGSWKEYDYWPIFMMVIVGGVMGVVFTTPLRRALIVDAGLQFPEGVATAEVLKSGGVERDRDLPAAEGHENGALGFRLLLEAGVIGGLFRILQGGMKWLADGAAGTKMLLGGKWLFTADITLAPSLLGIGFIVGVNIGILMLSGAVIGTILGVPINWLLNQDRLIEAAHTAVAKGNGDWSALSSAQQYVEYANASWQECRRIGIGGMLIGGLWSLVTLFKPMVSGVKASLAAYQAKRRGTVGGAARTEMDTPLPFLAIAAAVMTVPMFLAFHSVLDGYSGATWIALFMTVLMLGLGFLFCSVAGYMAGLVGSSNNPVSGVTMATVVLASVILLGLMGHNEIGSRLGPPAVIYLAVFICTSACIAGDNLQDLKCGHMVGSTPWKQQLCLVLGAIGSAIVIPIVLSLLDQGQGIGRPSLVNPDATPLSAPQATLMKDLSTGIFGTGINWNFILFGCALAVVVIAFDEYLKRRKSKFRTPILAVAVGIYLPFGISVLILVGGVLSWLASKRFGAQSHREQVALENSGMLLASGLITGEAIMSVVIALFIVIKEDLLPTEEIGIAKPLALLATLAMVAYLYFRTLRAARAMR